MNEPPPPLTSQEEEARLRTLSIYQILDTPPESEFDRITVLAARLLRAPISLVSLVAEGRQWFKSIQGIEVRETPRQLSFCAHALNQSYPLIVPDATQDPRFADNPLVTGGPGIRFYAGAPLLAPAFPGLDGTSAPGSAGKPAARFCLGTLCVIDTVPRPRALSEEESLTLQDLAALTVHSLLRRLAHGHHREEIAGRERAEAGWRRSEGRYARISANVLGVVFQLVRRADGSFDFPLIGEGCQGVLGFSPQEVRQTPRLLWHRVHPSDHPGLRKSLLKSARTLLPWRWEGRVQRADGAWRRIEAAACPDRLPDGATLWDGLLTDTTSRGEAGPAPREAQGRITGPTGSSPDTAERRANEHAVRDRARQQAAVVRLGQHALDLGDRGLDGMLHEAAREVAEALGADFSTVFEHLPEQGILIRRAGHGWPGGAIGETGTAVSAGTDSVAGYTLRTGRPVVRADMRGEPEFRFSGYARQHGAVGIISVVIVRDAAGAGGTAAPPPAPYGVLNAIFRQRRECSAEDVTFLQTVANLLAAAIGRQRAEDARRETGRRLRLALHAGAMGVWRFDLATGRMDWDKQVHRLNGWAPGTFPGTFQAFLDRVHPEDREALEGMTRRLMRESTEFAVQFRVRWPDGSVRWLEDRGAPDLDAAGQLRALTGVTLDVTERKRAELALREAKEEAERANAAKVEFLSRMSHELRTPLNAILGFGQLLELDAAQTDAQRESVEQILRGGRHLLSLIDEVLDISRVEAGQLTLDLEPISPVEVIEETLALARVVARERGVVIEPLVASAESVAREALGDARRLRQVLLNLLSNAVKYNRPAGRVTIALEPGEDAARTLRIGVTDTGKGITPEHQRRLFTPFDRLDADRGHVEGLGVGLALSKRLIEAQGGRIGLRSEPGVGSTFWVELPVAEHPVRSQDDLLPAAGRHGGSP